MNTLRIIKGKDISLFVNGNELCFIKEFCAKETVDYYKIEQMLCDEEVDFIKRKNGYVLTITTLSLFDSSVFENEPFTFSVCDENRVYSYLSCRLKEKQRNINPSGEILDKYIIEAFDMKETEERYER